MDTIASLASLWPIWLTMFLGGLVTAIWLFVREFRRKEKIKISRLQEESTGWFWICMICIAIGNIGFVLSILSFVYLQVKGH